MKWLERCLTATEFGDLLYQELSVVLTLILHVLFGFHEVVEGSVSSVDGEGEHED